MNKIVTFMWYSSDTFHYMFKAGFVTLVSPVGWTCGGTFLPYAVPEQPPECLAGNALCADRCAGMCCVLVGSSVLTQGERWLYMTFEIKLSWRKIEKVEGRGSFSRPFYLDINVRFSFQSFWIGNFIHRQCLFATYCDFLAARLQFITTFFLFFPGLQPGGRSLLRQRVHPVGRRAHRHPGAVATSVQGHDGGGGQEVSHRHVLLPHREEGGGEGGRSALTCKELGLMKFQRLSKLRRT